MGDRRIPEGWRECRLGEVAEINRNNIDNEYSQNKILYLDTSSITRGKVDCYQELLLSDAPSRAKRLVKDKDIIYSTVRPIQRHYGIIKNPPQNLVVSTGFTVIETNQKKADSFFIYYFLTSDEIVEYLDIIAEASTSAYPSLRPADIESLDILLPPLPEQRAIASVLSSLDDKIDLLNRENQTLEQMAEAIFRQWFIEEADEKWEEKQLGELITVKRGGSPRPIQDYLSETGYLWLKISDATNEKSPYIFEVKEHIKKSGLSKTILLKKGSLVLSNSATPGIPKILEVDACIHDGWLYFPNSYFSKEFLYLLFKTIRENLISYGNGSIFINLKTDILKNYKISVPEEKDLLVFQRKIESYFNKIIQNCIQIRTLEKLRDTLLPKLMSGEVRVKL
jgi:type I restriction enzyme S subunit